MLGYLPLRGRTTRTVAAQAHQYCFDMSCEQPVTFLDCLALPPDQRNLILGGNAAKLLQI